MHAQQEKKTTELRECALWLAQARAGTIRYTPEEYQAVYRRSVALLAAWRKAGWGERPPAGKPALRSAVPEPSPFARAA